MTRIDFYLLEQQTSSGIYPFACRLLEKVHKLSSVFILFNDLHECETFNKLLWIYHDISFIPHCLVTDEIAAETPVLLGLKSQLHNHPLVLNLSHETLTDLTTLKRIIEIVPSESNWRQAARQKYLAYKAQYCELYTHKIL